MENSYVTAKERKARKSIALLLSDNPLPAPPPPSSGLRFEILRCNENASILLIYNKALVSSDATMLKWFALHGRSVRQQVINIESRILARRYGYKLRLPASPLNSWINNSKWDSIEDISLVHPSDKKKGKSKSNSGKRRTGTQCEIRLATGANGKSTYSLNFSFYGRARQDRVPSYSDRPYNSRTDCLAAALDELEQQMLTYLQSSSHRSIKTGRNQRIAVSERNQAPAKIQVLKILQSIEDMRLKLFPQQRQLMIF